MLHPPCTIKIILISLTLITTIIKAQSNPKGFSGMNKSVFQNFVDAINEHNVDALCSLMTENHKFIDSQGNETAGKEKMRGAWTVYLQWFPDYKLEITDIFINGDTVAAFGFAGGTFQGQGDKKENYWHLPAAWKAIINAGKIELWQVYADAKIPFDIINKNRK